jgi:hypothetical protein
MLLLMLLLCHHHLHPMLLELELIMTTIRHDTQAQRRGKELQLIPPAPLDDETNATAMTTTVMTMMSHLV